MSSEPMPSRTSSPEKSLTSLLRRGSRRESRASSSQASVGSGGDGSVRSQRRNSLRSGFDKLKETTSRRSSEVDARAAESPSRLSRIVRSRSRRKSKDGEQGLNNDDYNAAESNGSGGGRLSRRLGRGLGIGVGNSEADNRAAIGSKLHVNASNDSLAPPRSAASSLLTEDSDMDSSPARPQFISRQSHRSLLTFNSPLIATETVPAGADELAQTVSATAVNASPAPGISSVIPSSLSSRVTAPAPLIAHTLSTEPGPTAINSATPISTGASSPIPNPLLSRDHLSRSGANTPKSPQSPRLVLSPVTSDANITPSAFVTPPTPKLGTDGSSPKTAAAGPLSALSTNLAAASGRDSTHRRTRSAVTPSSKFLTQTSFLSPTAEELKTPGGSVVPPSGSGGFFSSVFSATNNAINQISSTFQINSGPNQRARSGTSTSEPDKLVGDEEVILPSRAQTRNDPVAVEPAVKTLGSGNLSLSHLGISDNSQEHSPMSSQADLAAGAAVSPSLPAYNSEKDIVSASAAAAVDAAYNEKSTTQVVNDSVRPSSIRPLSISSAANSIPGDQTPSRRNTLSDPTILQRSGSVRSRFSGRRKKRSRGSSAATGSAIAAALAQSSSALVNPALGPQRTTGFAVASSKRNKDFHTLFKSVPEDDYLIEDYSAALQRDILLHGRMYVSERHICFSSNILGWQTNLVMNFDEVVAMEKKSTAVIFPNAIVIQTLHAKNVFASFLARDTTYDLLIGIWKIGHPNLKTSDNGHMLDDQAKSELADSIDGDDDSSDSSYSGEDGDSQELASLVEATPSLGGSEHGDAPRLPSHKISKSDPINGASTSPSKSPDIGAAAVEFPGPSTHAPTECTDQDSHFDKELYDTTIPAPLGRVYDMMFGPKSGAVMRKFLVDDQSSRELDMEDDKVGMGETVKTFSYSYIKPLNSSIGPKQTKCLVTQTLDAFDLEKAVSVTCSTQTPDVPSGNVFVTKTKYCLMWGPGNSTRFIMNFNVEWSGKSWIKGPIEKGANDGQVQYGKDIVRFLTAQVTSKSAKAPRAGGKVKGKKRSKNESSADGSSRGAKSTSAKQENRGLMGMLGPIGDIISPLLTPVTGLSILLIIMTTLWLRGGPSSAAKDSSGLDRTRQMGVYEELWWREENQLWDWLDDRLDLDDIATPLNGASEKRQAILRSSGAKVEKDIRDDRQLNEAIRVTEERLNTLKRSRGT